MKVIYVLPVRGLSGGANSVVQEVVGLQDLGCNALIAVNADNVGAFKSNYKYDRNALGRIVGYKDDAGLLELLSGADVVVATTNNTVEQLVGMVARMNGKKPALRYYVQDYELLFYPERSRQWDIANESYSFGASVGMFAKTDWLCSIVQKHHGSPVRRVVPSIDRSLFYPDFSTRSTKLTIAAMVRPATPRRAPRRTLRALNEIANQHGSKVNVVAFGCTQEELWANGLTLGSKVNFLGAQGRTQMGDLMRSTDLFLDLSDYQAFGRTAAEGMACGAVPVVPEAGGAPEFVTHGDSGYVVDTRSEVQILEAVNDYIARSPKARTEMQVNAIDAVAKFSIVNASTSLYRYFLEAV